MKTTQMLKQKFLLSYGLGLLSSFLGAILGIIVARICGPSVMGTIAFGLSFVSLFKFITDLGLNTTHIKFISEGGDMGEKNKTFLVLKFFSTILFLIVLLSVFIAQVFIFKVKFESGDHKIVVLLYIVIDDSFFNNNLILLWWRFRSRRYINPTRTNHRDCNR